ncbi:MAG: linear amide C-N hydrolase [Eubacteriaceae bacterium]|nr:linear amide C-N hydrolase [Eubacteriaceae bacterium]
MYHSRLKGTHYEAGFKYGSLLRKNGMVIKGSPTFALTEERKRFAKDCIPIYEKYYPQIAEEIVGMADGQGEAPDELFTILYSIYCFTLPNHCTCLAYSKDGVTFFGRNSDFLVSIEKYNTNCLYALKGALSFNGNTTAYIQMEDGVNEAGLAAGLTFAYPHIRKPGLNAGMLLRYIMENCRSVKEALEALQTLPIASSQGFTFADSSGEMAVAECNSEAIHIIRPRVNFAGMQYIACANNFTSKEMAAWRTPAGVDDWRADERYAVAMDALEKHGGNCDYSLAADILSGKYGFMCQYNRKTNADTVWSVIYDLSGRKIHRSEGNPSRKGYKEDTRRITK